MYDCNLRDRAELVIVHIEDTMKLKMEDIPEEDQPQNVDVFLETSEDWYGYYMVDLDKRALFWLEEYDATFIADYIGGIEDESQLCEHM